MNSPLLRTSDEFSLGHATAHLHQFQEHPSEPSRLVAHASAPARKQLILVVDDDPSMRFLTKVTLEAIGYRAILASDGAEAVVIFAQSGSEIAAVLTDMNMPMVDGKGTIQVLLKMDPHLPVIGMSGVSGLCVARDAGVEARFFLHKPFTAEQLLEVLQEALPPASTGGSASMS